MEKDAHLELYDWEEISDSYEHTLVLGNGASIAISASFQYASLFQSAIEAGIISEEINELFAHFETNNFEYVLRLVSNAQDVNSALRVEENETQKA